MMKAPIVIAATAIWLLGSVAAPTHASDKSKKRAAAAAAAIAAIAIVAAASKDRDKRYRYSQDYRRYDSGPRLWSPAPGVTCYANTRSCYVAGRGYSPSWTRHEFF